jgi:hypothetical protein
MTSQILSNQAHDLEISLWVFSGVLIPVLNLLQEWLLEGDIGSTIFPEKSR